MRLPDTNVLLYAVNEDSLCHVQARRWLEDAFADRRGVALSWIVLLGFVRIATRVGALRRPLEVGQALGVMEHWLAQGNAHVVHPGHRHAALLGRLLVGAGTAGNLTTDAHLAALAIENGATLASFDRDFRRFAGLDFEYLGAPTRTPS